MSMPARHLTSLQLQAILQQRGVTLPSTVLPQSALVELCTKHGIKEVPLSQLASLHASSVGRGGHTGGSTSASAAQR